MGNGWINCGCTTTLTDAYGNPVNGPGSGADGSAVATCAPDFGLLACAAIAAIAAIGLASSGKKKAA